MPKLIVSLDGILVKQVQLTKSRSTIGRRPYNDIVIDNLAVSGEHAVITITGNQVLLEDLGSTNGTYVNGQAIRKQSLEYGDRIEIGRYKIQYLESVDKTVSAPLEKHDEIASGDAGAVTIPSSISHHGPPTLNGDAIEGPHVKVLNGVSAGRSMALTKVVTTIGKPGVSVASITRRGHGYDLAHVTGEQTATVNGVSVDANPITLQHHDRVNVGGVELEFFQA
ncbi:MAG: FHA domain-containing protein [Burkholderiaceae bacterium]|jgi:pSer/pThr/pTyr-binding forkhead associated (FHA) protein|nr:FHA domain-containing protein [Burkholderiaceae bacterium]